jgi:hypothetical protein
MLLAWGGYFKINGYILRCAKDPYHTGIAREAKLSSYDTPDELNIGNMSKIRRKQLEKELGEQKATALAVYAGKGQLTVREAQDIISTVWPGAPAVEVKKAAIVCQIYGLNPLMKHLYLIPFDKKKKVDNKWIVESVSYAMVLGIKASRIIARRKGAYAYLDDTPRIMTTDEQMKIFGEVDNDNICAITRLKDEKGNTAIGTGKWARTKKDYQGNVSDNQPQGADKGNTKLNMAMIRSERQALERLFPDSMPTETGTEVIDERYQELPSGEKVDVTTGEIAAPEQPVDGEYTESPDTDSPEPEKTPPAAKQGTKETFINSWGALEEAAMQQFKMSKEKLYGMFEAKDGHDLTIGPAECWERVKLAKTKKV